MCRLLFQYLAAASFLCINSGSTIAQVVVTKPSESDAAFLVEKYAALTPKLADNIYRRPIFF